MYNQRNLQIDVTINKIKTTYFLIINENYYLMGIVGNRRGWMFIFTYLFI